MVLTVWPIFLISTVFCSGIMVLILNLVEGCLGGHLLILIRLGVTFVLAIFLLSANSRALQFWLFFQPCPLLC